MAEAATVPRDPENLAGLCRLCACPAESRLPLFEGEGLLRQIPAKLALLPVEVVQGDALPQVACSECLLKLDTLSQFLHTVKSADTRLRQLCSSLTENIKVEPDVDFDVYHAETSTSDDEQILKEKSDPINSELNIPHASPAIIVVGNITNTPNCVGAEPRLARGKSRIAGRGSDRGLSPGKSPVYQCYYCKAILPCLEATQTHIQQHHAGGEAPADTRRPLRPRRRTVRSTPMESGSESDPPDLPTPSTEERKPALPRTRDKVPFHGCRVCYLVFPSAKVLAHHMANHDSLVHCRLCDLKFQTQAALDHHVITHASSGGKEWKCSICDSRLRKSKMLSHVQKHKETGTYKCTECGKIFNRYRALQSHKRMHTKDWSFVCNFCGKGFVERSSFQNHLKLLHSTERPWKCDQCVAAFKLMAHLRQHMEAKHSKVEFTCEVCKKTFKSKKYLISHMENHVIPLEERQKYSCMICDQRFTAKLSYQRHMETHTGARERKRRRRGTGEERRLECHICGRVAATAQRLRNHLVSHTGIKSYICDQCGKAYAKQQSLKEHLRVSHLGERPYKCEICNSTFTQRTSLVGHMQSQHNTDVRIRRLKKN